MTSGGAEVVDLPPPSGKPASSGSGSCPGAAGSAPQEWKNPGRRKGWEWKQSRLCNRELARGHDAVPEEQMRSSYLRRQEGGEVALPMPWAPHGCGGEAARNSPALSEAPIRFVLPRPTGHTAGWRQQCPFSDARVMYPAPGTVSISPAPRRPCRPGALPGAWGSVADALLPLCRGLPVTVPVEPEPLVAYAEGHRARQMARRLLTSAVMEVPF